MSRLSDRRTGYSATDTGIGAVIGGESQQVPDVFGTLLSKWAKGRTFLHMGHRGEPVESRKYYWEQERKPPRSTLAYTAHTPFDDIPQSDVDDDIDNQWNMIRRYKEALEFADEAEIIKQRHTKKRKGKRKAQRLIDGMLAAFCLDIMCSELSDSSMGDPAERFAGFGVNQAGTALRPRASAHWTTDQAHAGHRMTYQDMGGAQWTFAHVQAAMMARETKTGISDCDIHADTHSMNVAATWTAPREQVTYEAGQYHTEMAITSLTTPTGRAMLHREVDTDSATGTWPAAAIWYGEHGEEFWEYCTLEGMGLQIATMGKTGDSAARMLKMVVGLRIIFPQAFVVAYDRGLSAVTVL